MTDTPPPMQPPSQFVRNLRRPARVDESRAMKRRRPSLTGFLHFRHDSPFDCGAGVARTDAGSDHQSSMNS